MNKRVLRAAILLVACAALLSACCWINPTTCNLKEFKTHAATGDNAWLAKRKVTCKQEQEGCNQLHLIKGDACLQLAKQKQDEMKHYSCAASELRTGIDFTKDWQLGTLNLNRGQTYENLCEALRGWQDKESGAKADDLARKLLASARELRAFAPARVGAVFFENSARYTLLHACLIDPAACPSICSDLKTISKDLGDHETQAEQDARYRKPYRQLQENVQRSRNSLPGCQ